MSAIEKALFDIQIVHSLQSALKGFPDKLTLFHHIDVWWFKKLMTSTQNGTFYTQGPKTSSSKKFSPS